MPGFMRCLKMQARFDAVALHISFCGAVPGLGLSFFVASLLIRHKCLVCGRNALTIVVGEGYPTYYPVLVDTKERRNGQEGAHHPGRRRVEGMVMRIQNSIEWSGSQEGAWRLVRHRFSRRSHGLMFLSAYLCS